MRDCLFCNENFDIIIENDFCYAVFDHFPVSPGHMLIIPKNHYNTYFDQPIHTSLWNLVDESKYYLDKKFSPDGYNVGMNCGKAAGQTINHLHIHLIPRYSGDMVDPSGGIRGVIPKRQKY